MQLLEISNENHASVLDLFFIKCLGTDTFQETKCSVSGLRPLSMETYFQESTIWIKVLRLFLVMYVISNIAVKYHCLLACF